MYYCLLHSSVFPITKRNDLASLYVKEDIKLILLSGKVIYKQIERGILYGHDLALPSNRAVIVKVTALT